MWYGIVKTFRGGSDEFQIIVPDGVRLDQNDWDTIMEWLGDSTDGGHSAGYRMTRRRLKQKSRKLRVVAYPSYLTEATMQFGRVVTTTERMIGS